MRWRELNDQCTTLTVAVLRAIERDLLRCYWNKNQKEMASPFANTANSYKCDAFKVHAYDWSDEGNINNFVYVDKNLPQSNMVVTWYKHLGRGDCVMVPGTWKPEYLADMLERCMHSIEKDFGEIVE